MESQTAGALEARYQSSYSEIMTRIPRARLVLKDTQHVREKLEDETGQVEWRLYWVLAVVLLRTVGHVLDKVDGANDANVKKAVNSLYQSWKTGDENAIFREFIDRERNTILKEYEFTMSEGPVPMVARLQQPDGSDTIHEFLIEENIYRPMLDGEFAGEDGRTLVDEAISWWARQFEEIDRMVA